MGFSSASLFPLRKQEAVIQGGNHGSRPSDAEENPGRSIVKEWEEKQDRGGAFQIHTRRKRILRAHDPPKIEPRLPIPYIYKLKLGNIR